MPRTIKVGSDKLPVATEGELLAFANEIRQAGGAGVIEALLPSNQADAGSCLIANALNFSCTVCTNHGGALFTDGSHKWRMNLPPNLTDEQRKSLGAVKGVRLKWDDENEEHYLTLPKHIGNAAHAFDLGAAFQSYIIPDEDAL